MKRSLLIAVAIGLFLFLIYIIRDLRIHKKDLYNKNISDVKGSIAGFIIFTLDALGIGSFATTTAFFNKTNYVKHMKDYPGTMNISSIVPTALQVFLFVTFIRVDIKMIFLCIFSALIGGYLGPKILKRISGNKIRLIIGVSLVYVSIFMIFETCGILDGNSSSDVTSIGEIKLIILSFCAFLFAIFRSFGIGAYSLYIILFVILGIHPISAWPVMSVTTFCRTCVSSYEFMKLNMYKRKQSVVMSVGGIFGVIFAGYLLENISTYIFIIIAVLVIFFTGVSMCIKAFKKHIDKSKKK